jgi:phosphonate transport system substrate-binding protein
MITVVESWIRGGDRRGRRRTAVAIACALVGGFGLAGGGRAQAAEAGDAAAPAVRFGFFRTMFRDVNENDIRASLKAYARAVALDRAIRADPDPMLFDGADDAAAALRAGGVDLISGSTPELLRLPAGLLTGPYLLSLSGDAVGTEYQLLVRRDAKHMRVAGLRGRSLVLVNSSSFSLAVPWLELLVSREAQADPGAFFGSVKVVNKASLAALPVFFQQVDACVVTRAGFAVLAELNPQLARELRPIATSPRVVPILSCFRAGYDPAVKQRIAASMVTLQDTAAGRQLLTIFQSGPIAPQDEDALVTTRRLFSDHAGLRATGAGSLLTPAP